MKNKALIFMSAMLCIIIVAIINFYNYKKENYSNENTSNSSEIENENKSQTDDFIMNSDINLFSDDTKYVSKFDDVTKHVLYYNEDEITAFYVFTEYENNDGATKANKSLTKSDLIGIEKHFVKDNYLVLKYKENQYDDLKASELKELYLEYDYEEINEE